MIGECVMHFLPLVNFFIAFDMLCRFLNVIFRTLSPECEPKMQQGVILQYLRVCSELIENSFYKTGCTCCIVKKKKASTTNPKEVL